MVNFDEKTLQQLPNISRLSTSQLGKIAANLTIRNFKKDQLVFAQDEQARLVYLLISGVARVFHNGNERQTIVSLLSPGQFFGLDSLMPKSSHPFGCDAFETSTIGSIKPQLFVEMLFGTSYENFLVGFAATLQLGRQSYVHCIRRIALDVRRRMALELLNLAEQFGSPDARGTLITLAISHETLASIVGASRQQVTEYLNEFDRGKIISREGRSLIVDLKKLRRVIENRP